MGPEILPEPGPRVAVSPKDVDILIATAHQHGGVPDTTKTATVELGEQPSFKKHLFNIAHQRGWYAHTPEQRGINLVLPKQDLHHLDEMTQAPTTWTLRNIDPEKPAIGPSNTDLTHVEIEIVSPTSYLWFSLTAVVIWIAAAFGIAAPMVY